MRIELSGTTAILHDAADLKRLSVTAPAGTDLGAAIASFGRADSDGAHVWLGVDQLRTAGAAAMPEAARSEWESGFDGMIAYARSKGWTDESGTAVRAHVETA